MKDLVDAFARRILFVPVAAVRPYLVLKGTLLLLAFDMWLTRIEHGGRYGAGSFNVAHFAWLDAVQPEVTAGLYVGVSIVTGLLCFALVLVPAAPRWLLALTFVLHTWSWAMSMLDSYQHHYLLSLVLLALVFFPRPSAEDALLAPAPPPTDEKKADKRSKKKSAEPTKQAAPLLARAPLTSAWAYVALSVAIAVVYAYTAYSKTDPEWLSGAAFRRVLGLPLDGVVPEGAEDRIGLFRGIAGTFGIEGESFWWLMGHSVVLVQMICCAGYLLAPFRDVTRHEGVKIFVWIALATALSFHVGAEVMDLKIGWFSWYMIGYALVYMLPASVLAPVARAVLPLSGNPYGLEVLALRLAAGLIVLLIGAYRDSGLWMGIGAILLLVTPVRWLLKLFTEKTKSELSWYAAASALAGAIALVVAGSLIDLPGAPASGIIAACALGAGIVALLVKEGGPRTIHPYGVGAALGAAAFFVAILLSTVRFDFYRNVGGDHRRRGELRAAYVAYVKANRYAPEGENRARHERELRAILEERGELPQVDE